MLTAGPVSKMASQQEKAFYVLPLPPRSPDLTPCDFFLWGLVNPLNAELNPICHLLALLGARHIFHVSGLRVKDSIYVPQLPMSLKELRDRITHALQTITADMLHRVWDESDYRVDVCRVTQGAHIEEL